MRSGRSDERQSASVPNEAHTREFPDFCARRYRDLAPLVEWLAALTVS